MKQLTVWLLLLSINSTAQKKQQVNAIEQSLNQLKQSTIGFLESTYPKDKATAFTIWDYAELGYKETKSAALHVKHLQEAGFTVETGVAGIPTAFVATYGSGSPVIGILAEYDALPGLAQEAIAEKKSIDGKIAGHGCGHHLFGTASVSAGIAIKQ